MSLAEIEARCQAAGVPYLSRAEWGASVKAWTWSTGAPIPMQLPVAETWVHHTVTDPTDDPAADMREIEAIGLERFGRFPYSWVIHPMGVVMEGCGLWIGAHTATRNSTSFGICHVGNYQAQTPTTAELHAHSVLLAALISDGALVAGSYPTGGHRDTKATACPGDLLYARLSEITSAPPPPEPGRFATMDTATDAGGVLHTVVVGADHKVYKMTGNPDGPLEPLGGSVRDVSIGFHSGTCWVIGHGLGDNRLYMTRWTGEAWIPWYPHPHAVLAD